MVYKVGEQINSLTSEVFVIEASMVAGASSLWTPLSINATPRSRKLGSDRNRATRIGMIDLRGICAYRHVEHAVAAMDILTKETKATRFRLVKMSQTLVKTFQDGVAVP